MAKIVITSVIVLIGIAPLMWIFYGIGFSLCLVCGFPFGEKIAAILCIVEAIGGLFGMIAYHNKLNRRYCK